MTKRERRRRRECLEADCFGPMYAEDDPDPVHRPTECEQCQSCRWRGKRCPGLTLGPEGCRYHYPSGPVCANCKHRRQYFDGRMICGLTGQVMRPDEPGCYFWEGRLSDG